MKGVKNVQNPVNHPHLQANAIVHVTVITAKEEEDTIVNVAIARAAPAQVLLHRVVQDLLPAVLSVMQVIPVIHMNVPDVVEAVVVAAVVAAAAAVKNVVVIVAVVVDQIVGHLVDRIVNQDNLNLNHLQAQNQSHLQAHHQMKNAQLVAVVSVVDKVNSFVNFDFPSVSINNHHLILNI